MDKNQVANFISDKYLLLLSSPETGPDSGDQSWVHVYRKTHPPFFIFLDPEGKDGWMEEGYM